MATGSLDEMKDRKYQSLSLSILKLRKRGWEGHTDEEFDYDFTTEAKELIMMASD